MRKSTRTCQRCKRAASQPIVQTVTIDSPKPGRTLLGRQVPLSASIGYWLCPKCGQANVESLGLMLDPDAALVRAYEKHFGKPDGPALAALAKLNADFIRRFGEDWQQQFGGEDQVEAIVRMAVQGFKDEAGEDWAAAMAQAEWEFVAGGEGNSD